MKRGYPVFTWKQRFTNDPELNVNYPIEDEVSIDDNDNNEDNTEQTNAIPEQEMN